MLWQPQSQCIYADKWAMSLLYQPRQPNLLSKSDWKDTHRSVHPNPITSRSSACRVRNVIVDRSRRRIVVVAWVCLVECWTSKISSTKKAGPNKIMWSSWCEVGGGTEVQTTTEVMLGTRVARQIGGGRTTYPTYFAFDKRNCWVPTNSVQ